MSAIQNKLQQKINKNIQNRKTFRIKYWSCRKFYIVIYHPWFSFFSYFFFSFKESQMLKATNGVKKGHN